MDFPTHLTQNGIGVHPSPDHDIDIIVITTVAPPRQVMCRHPNYSDSSSSEDEELSQTDCAFWYPGQNKLPIP